MRCPYKLRRASLGSKQLWLRVAEQSDRLHLLQHLVSERQGIADDPHARAGRQRLSGCDLGNVDHVTAAMYHHDAGLPEEGIYCLLCGMTKPTSHAGMISSMSTPRREYDDWLVAGQLPGDSGEFSRVADRVQGEQADPCGLVVPPILHHVVGSYVGVVTRTDEAGQTEVLADRVVEQGDTDSRRLAEQPHSPGTRHRSWRCVQRNGAQGVDDAKSVRTKRPDPVRPGQIDDLEIVTHVVIGSGQHHHAVSTLVGRFDHDCTQLVRRHGDDRQVQATWYLGDVSRVGHACNRSTIDAYGHHLAVIAALHDRIDQVPYSITLSVHHDPPRIEQPSHRGTFGSVLAAFHDANGGIGGQDRKLDSQHAIFDALGYAVAGISEHFGHPPVLR